MGDIWTHIVADFANIGSPSALAAFVQVLMIDVMLAGDNPIVVGALAAGLPAKQRKLPETDWLEQDSLVCCPDPDERVVMRIERTRERVLRTEDLT